MFAADTLSRLPNPDAAASVPLVNLMEINTLDEFRHSSSLLQRCASTDGNNSL